MAFYRFEGITAHFAESGAGPDLVLLHAGGSSGAQWRKVAAELDSSFRLVMPDFFGCGETGNWHEPSEPSHDDQARLIACLIAERCACPVDLVGHSFGGAVAVRLALARPENIRRLVLIEPVLAPLLDQAGETAAFAEYCDLANTFIDNAQAGRDTVAWRRFIDYRNGDGTWDGLTQKARDRFLAGTRQALETYKSNLANPTTIADCRSLGMPTLILCGENTTAPDRLVTEILHREIPGAGYHVLRGAAHMSPLTHPEPVAAAIQAHLTAARSGAGDSVSC